MQVDLLESEFEVEGVRLISLGHLLGKMFFIIGYVECIQGFILRELQHHPNVEHAVALSAIEIDLKSNEISDARFDYWSCFTF